MDIRRIGLYKIPRESLIVECENFIERRSGLGHWKHITVPIYFEIEFHSEMANSEYYARKIIFTTKDGSKYMKIFKYHLASRLKTGYIFTFNEGVKECL